MKINITLDTSAVSRLITRLGKSRIIAGTVVLVLAGASTYAYAIAQTPTHVFTPNTAISAGDVNTNFAELFLATNAVESEVTTLQTNMSTLQTDATALETRVTSTESDVTTLQSATPLIHSCSWQLTNITGPAGDVLCPTGQFPISGSCFGQGAAIGSSRPIISDPADVTSGTGWRCNAPGATMVDARVLCCPQ